MQYRLSWTWVPTVSASQVLKRQVSVCLTDSYVHCISSTLLTLKMWTDPYPFPFEKFHSPLWNCLGSPITLIHICVIIKSNCLLSLKLGGSGLILITLHCCLPFPVLTLKHGQSKLTVCYRPSHFSAAFWSSGQYGSPLCDLWGPACVIYLAKCLCCRGDKGWLARGILSLYVSFYFLLWDRVSFWTPVAQESQIQPE